ncbi:hypothetical protein GF366_00400 [Candidatus Peregrinibacteria bacterium]|nr:hypothetical protein [Candidatus Peregrinibacteria bacterium]
MPIKYSEYSLRFLTKKAISGLIILILLTQCMTKLEKTYASHFPDVKTSYKYFDAIEFLAENNIISGYPDGTYKKENILNRAELLKIIIEASFEKEIIENYPQKNCFKDVPEKEWYTKYVCFAKKEGIINGYPDDTFRPENKIILTEALKISLEVFKYDYKETGPWYKGLINSASDHNIIPLDFTRFDQKVNRGQIADLITRILSFKKGSQSQEEHLDSEKNIKVTYESLKDNINVVMTQPKDIRNKEIKNTIKLNIPFTVQAPFQKWIHPYDEACEEASMIMANYYLNGKTLSKEEAASEILKIIKWEEQYNYGIDIGAMEISDIMTHYYGKMAQVYVNSDISIENMKKFLSKGYSIILPVAGQILNNPNFTGDGPPYHVVLVTGYDKNFFFAHDPGTYKGEHYAYPQTVLYNAIHDWTGSKSTILEGKKAMVVVQEQKTNN